MLRGSVSAKREAYLIGHQRFWRKKPFGARIGAYGAALIILDNVKVGVAVHAVLQTDVEGVAVIGRGQSPCP